MHLKFYWYVHFLQSLNYNKDKQRTKLKNVFEEETWNMGKHLTYMKKLEA